MVLDTGGGMSSAEQEYDTSRHINEIRSYVEAWRNLPNPDQWNVTPETARLLQHWRHHQIQGNVLCLGRAVRATFKRVVAAARGALAECTDGFTALVFPWPRYCSGSPS
jgi:hypothetical protein